MSENNTLHNEIERNCQNVERLLIVCTGNTCRSPMAAALARKYMPWAEVISAGTATVAGLPASIGAMDAMQQMGLSIDDHASRPVNQYLLEEADLILTMTEEHKKAILNFMPETADKVFTLGEFAGTAVSIPDPFGMPVEEYLKCAKNLEILIKAAAEKCRPPKTE
ncbi:MAG: low molecular weight protein arginine phosphatase [Bacillota bacterium]|jgi:protein-tyrosine-phosphatase